MYKFYYCLRERSLNFGGVVPFMVSTTIQEPSLVRLAGYDFCSTGKKIESVHGMRTRNNYSRITFFVCENYNDYRFRCDKTFTKLTQYFYQSLILVHHSINTILFHHSSQVLNLRNLGARLQSRQRDKQVKVKRGLDILCLQIIVFREKLHLRSV